MSFQPTGRTCTICQGTLRDTLLDWEDALPESDFERAQDECETPGTLVLCLGTSLRIEPVGSLPESAERFVIVNLQKTPLDEGAALVIRGPVDEVMDQLVVQWAGLPHWKQEPPPSIERIWTPKATTITTTTTTTTTGNSNAAAARRQAPVTELQSNYGTITSERAAFLREAKVEQPSNEDDRLGRKREEEKSEQDETKPAAKMTMAEDKRANEPQAAVIKTTTTSPLATEETMEKAAGNPAAVVDLVELDTDEE
jgi:hypothetical protein